MEREGEGRHGKLDMEGKMLRNRGNVVEGREAEGKVNDDRSTYL